MMFVDLYIQKRSDGTSSLANFAVFVHKNCTYPVESRTYAFRVVFVFMLLCVLVLLLLPFLFCFANYVPSVVCCVLLSQRLCTWPAIKGDLVDVAAGQNERIEHQTTRPGVAPRTAQCWGVLDLDPLFTAAACCSSEGCCSIGCCCGVAVITTCLHVIPVLGSPCFGFRFATQARNNQGNHNL